jgi:hypothetical protein
VLSFVNAQWLLAVVLFDNAQWRLAVVLFFVLRAMAVSRRVMNHGSELYPSTFFSGNSFIRFLSTAPYQQEAAVGPGGTCVKGDHGEAAVVCLS